MGTTPRIPKTGDVLADKYVLRERIGEGGMGLVFRAEQPALGRSVAIKVMHPKLIEREWGVRRFCDEAIAASRVDHPGAISVIECDLLADPPFIVMEHVGGHRLGGLIPEEGMPVPRALAIIDQLLDALVAAHAAGIVHADIKSDNVLVEQRADREVAVLIDFGLACLDGAWSDTQIVSGTPEYMAPEVVRGGPPTPASDVYGAAVILHELLTGATPFAGGSAAEVFERHVHEPPLPPSARRRTPDVPAAVDEVVLRALAKDPAARFADAAEMQLALRRAGVGASPEPPTCERPTQRVGLARGSDACPLAEHGDGPIRPRRAIARALIRGDVTAIADGYVELAEAMARDHRLEDAIRELEEGIDVLTAGHADHTREGHRLVVALAALSKRLEQARRLSRLQAASDARDTLPDVRHALRARALREARRVGAR